MWGVLANVQNAAKAGLANLGEVTSQLSDQASSLLERLDAFWVRFELL